MKYQFWILMFLIFPSFSFTQSSLNPTIEEARELYMRSVMSDSLNPNYNNPFLDTTEINRIFHQMNLVDQFLYSDNSFHRIRNIRPRQSYSVKEFMIKPNLDTLDLSKNEQLEYIALPKELEAFMKKYDFHLIYLFMNIKPGENWYGIRTNRDYNFHTLAKKLRQLDVIKYVDYYGGITMGDGSIYDFDFKGDTTICTISIGWGDCPAGCINRRFWEFTIFNDNVTHSRTYGSGTKSKKKSSQDCFYYANIRNLIIGTKNCKGIKINDSLYYNIKIRPSSIYFFDENCQAIFEKVFNFQIDKIVYNQYSHCLIGSSKKGMLFKYDIATEKTETLIPDLGYLPYQMLPDDSLLVITKEDGQFLILDLETKESKSYKSKSSKGKGWIDTDTSHNLIYTICELEGICKNCLIRYKGIEIDTSDYMLKPHSTYGLAIENKSYLIGSNTLFKIEFDTIINVAKILKQKYNIQDSITEIDLKTKNIAVFTFETKNYVFNLSTKKMIHESPENTHVKRWRKSKNFIVQQNSKPYTYKAYDEDGNEIVLEFEKNEEDLCECKYGSSYKIITEASGVIEFYRWDDEYTVRSNWLDPSWVDSKPLSLKLEVFDVVQYDESYTFDNYEKEKYHTIYEFSSKYTIQIHKRYHTYAIIEKGKPESRIQFFPLSSGLLLYDDKNFTCLGERCGITFPEHLVETEDLLFEKFGIKSTPSF